MFGKTRLRVLTALFPKSAATREERPALDLHRDFHHPLRIGAHLLEGIKQSRWMIYFHFRSFSALFLPSACCEDRFSTSTCISGRLSSSFKKHCKLPNLLND